VLLPTVILGRLNHKTMTYKSIVIDDSSVHRLAISFLIKNHPKLELVGTYADPYEGMEALYRHKVDIVFLDVLLEGVDAFELLDAIEMPASIVLNSSWEKFSNRAQGYGIQNFLVKPMRKDSFETTVNDIIRSLDMNKTQSLSHLKPYLVKNPNVFKM
jgi:two-component SAPR family response regulator